MSLSTRARLKLALNETNFFPLVAQDAGTTREEWRMNITIRQDTPLSARTAVCPNQSSFLDVVGRPGTPFLQLFHDITAFEVADAIEDRHNAVRGIIPDGGQGIRLTAANKEYMIAGMEVDECAVQEATHVRTMEWYGRVHTVPTSGQIISLGSITNSVGTTRWLGLWVDSSGNVRAYLNSGTHTTSFAMPIDQDVHLVMTAGPDSAPSGEKVKIFINGALVAQAGSGAVSIPTGDGAVVVGKSLNSVSPGQYGNFTLYYLGFYTAILTPTQVLNHYNALAWTEITDVLRRESVVVERGIRDDSPLSRTAPTGTCNLSLNNAENNSGKKIGYYSPGHVNCRVGFKKGIPAWVEFIDYAGNVTDQFFGRISRIFTVPGFEQKLTQVTIRDIMNVAAKTRLTGIPIQTSVRSDQIFELLTSKLRVQPQGLEIDTGSDVFPLALDNSQDEKIDVLAEYVRLQHNELGYTYVKRDGTLKFEARDSRIINSPDPIFTLVGTTRELDVAEVSEEALNLVQVTVHPRKVDSAATTVLWSLEELVRVNKGETKTFTCPYRNPATPTLDARVGGLDMVTPAATTDYQLNTALDGSGLDLTAYLVVAANFGANSATLVVTNNHPLYDGYLVAAGGGGAKRLQIRGKGVYDFRTIVLESKDQAAIDEFGVNDLQLDMVYQADPNLGQGAADLLFNTWSGLTLRARSAQIISNDPRFNLNTILTLEISDRIAVQESVSGLNSEYYINGIKHEIDSEGHVHTTFWLTPADPLSYWILGDSVYSVLDFTTRLFYL